MGIAYFQKGAVIQINEFQHVLRREVDKGVWQTEETAGGRLHRFTTQELLELYEKGELIFFDDRKLTPVKPKQASAQCIMVRPEPREELWDTAKLRRVYVKAVQDLPATRQLFERAIMTVWEQCRQPKVPPHWVTVLRWRNRFINYGGDTHSLVEQHQDKGNRNHRYPDLVLQLIEEMIENVYLTRERNGVTKVMEFAIDAVDKENRQRPESMRLPLPTRRLIQGMINLLPAFDKHAARYGRTAAIRKFRAVLNHAVTEKRLEIAEIDHTKLDLFVLSDDGAYPLGRPWVTVCIDNHTRCILGIYIGFEPPSYLSVARCLKHAFMPKTMLRQEYPSIRHEWEAFGVMGKLVVDNGLEFHGKSLEQACLSFDVEIIYTPRKSPWFKGKIERFMRTLNEGVSYGTPGTTFSNIFEKDDYDPAKHAVVRLSALREIVHKWVADYYHQKPHSSLDKAKPAEFWASSTAITSIPLPADPGTIDVMLGKPDTASLTHKGIRCNRLDYNSAELIDWRRQYADKMSVDIRIDESNLGYIHVKHPESSCYVKVPALNRQYAEGISLWQHNVFRNFAIRQLGKDDPASWARASVEISEIIQRETLGKKRKSNSKLGRFQEAAKAGRKGSVSTPVLPQPQPAATIPVIPPACALPRPKLNAVIEQRGK